MLMATKKKAKTVDATVDDNSWEDIGRIIGQKVGSGVQSGEFKSWTKQKFVFKEEHGGGFGRLLFAIGIIVLLTSMGVIPTMAWWMYVLIIGGFALMRF